MEKIKSDEVYYSFFRLHLTFVDIVYFQLKAFSKI